MAAGNQRAAANLRSSSHQNAANLRSSHRIAADRHQIAANRHENAVNRHENVANRQENAHSSSRGFRRNSGPVREDDEDGVHGGRMKPLTAVCSNTMASVRKPLAPLARCKSSRSNPIHSDADKENLLPCKRKPTLQGDTRDKCHKSSEGNDENGNMDVLFMALEKCSNRESREPDTENRTRTKTVCNRMKAVEKWKRVCMAIRKRKAEKENEDRLKRAKLEKAERAKGETEDEEETEEEDEDEKVEIIPELTTKVFGRTDKQEEDITELDKTGPKSPIKLPMADEKDLSRFSASEIDLFLGPCNVSTEDEVPSRATTSEYKESETSKENEELEVTGGFKPGIMNRVRHGKKVRAILGSIAGVQEESCQQTRLESFKSSDPEGTNNMSCSKQESESLFATPMFANAAANVAFRWLDLLSHDLKGRIAALKRSRRNVRGVIVSGQFGKIKGSSRLDAHAAQNDENGKWLNLFVSMDANLAAEGAKLESTLKQVQEMQRYCMLDSEENGITQQTGIARAPVDKSMALAASASAICSTANFTLKNE